MTKAQPFPRRRLKYVATINDEALTEDTHPDEEIQYIDIGNVSSNGEVNEIATYRFKAAPSRARRIVRNGDVIISTVRTYLQAITHIENPPENLIVSTGFAVIRPKDGILDAGFSKFALRERQFLDEVMVRSTGVSYPAITAAEVADISISLPPLPTQRRVADFLDRETAQIDALIEAKEQMLALLQEKRAAQISHMVTKGLDSNAEMKDSGLEWLGEIPAHWEVKRAKQLFDLREELSENGEEELLTVSHITGVTPRAEKDVYMFKAEDMTGYKICKPNDLVINTLWAWMGAMGVAWQEGIVSPAYHVYTPKPAMYPDYVDLFCRAKPFVAEVIRFSKGVWSSRLRLYPESFLDMRLAVPPLEEQKEMVRRMAVFADQDRQFQKSLNDSISLLRERRSALITAAVTGQLAEVLE